MQSRDMHTRTWTRGHLAFCAAVVPAAFVAAAVFPLATYSLTLACCGLPHVLSELRYVDARFRARLPATCLSLVGALLALVVLGRLGGLLDWWPTPVRAELCLVALLGSAVLLVPGVQILVRVLVLGLIVVLGVGVTWAPLTTFVLLAVLHNVTPVGFVAERLRGPRRRRALLVCLLVFGALPLLILLGAPEALFASDPDRAPFRLEGLRSQLGAFVPPDWQEAAWATRWFSAVAFLQCLHYLYVLVLLPALDGESAWRGATGDTLIRWPSPRAFAMVLAAVGFVSLLAFSAAFGETRSWYGLAAAVHAWIEVPVLLAAPALLAASR